MQQELLIYPGQYIPVRRKPSSLVKKGKRINSLHAWVPVNIKERREYFDIEVLVPGFDKEKFQITASENFLLIAADKQGVGAAQSPTLKQKEFSLPDCFERTILLPENADTALTSAAYKSGILYLRVPKSARPLRLAASEIIVY